MPLPIPLYILEKGTKIPDETCYLLGKNGLFLRKRNGLVEATVKIEGISFLEEIKPSARLNLPKISPEIMVRTILFFRRVHVRFGSEAMVLLHYSKENGYELSCPPQRVGPASVHYDADERLEGYLLVGTIHSHNNFNAFHSGVDSHDERHFDGLHITLGFMNQPYFTISCSIVVNGTRYSLVPENTVTGIKKTNWKPTPEKVRIYQRERVPRPEHDFFTEALINFTGGPDWYDYMPPPSRDQFYDMVLPESKDYRHVGFPTNWLEKVSRESFFFDDYHYPAGKEGLTDENPRGGPRRNR